MRTNARKHTLTLTAANGIRFAAQIIRSGDKYGRDNCLQYDKNAPCVEFYDTRYPFDLDKQGREIGQFIGRYYVKTLQNRDRNHGLDLHGGVPDWKIDRQTMTMFHDWLDNQTA